MVRGLWLAAGALVLAGCAISRPVAPPALLRADPPVFPSEYGELRADSASDAAGEVPRALREFVEGRTPRTPGSDESWLLDVSARVPATSEEIAGVRLAARRVSVRLEQGFAHTVIEEELANESANELEGKLVFRLPPRAVLGKVALWVDGVPIEAAVVEKERGRAVYGAIVDVARRDPALVERQPGGRVSVRVFPIPPRGSRRVSYAYDEPLVEATSGVSYRLPLALPDWAPTLGELSIEIELVGGSDPPVAVNDRALRLERRAGRTSLTRRARAVRPEDLVVMLPGVRAPALAGSAPDGDGERVAALRLAQPGAAPNAAPSALAIVIDTSAGQRGAALSESARLAQALVAGLERRQRFTVLGCDSACAAYPATGLAFASADQIEAARAFLAAFVASGASDAVGAVTEARARLEGEARAQLVVFGDMQASTGAFVRGRATRMSRNGLDLRLVGLGAGVEMSGLSRVAAEMGAARLLVAPGDQLGAERLRQWLAAPTSVQSVALPNGLSEMAPLATPLVVAGDSEIVLARAGAGFRAAPSSAGFEGPARLWASERIGELELAEEGAGTRAIVELARRYGVLSERTALIALDSAPAFQRFGIERHSSRTPTVRMASTTVSGRLPPEAIQRSVREHFGRFRACYHQGLLRNPALAGVVLTRFVIARDGSVQQPKSEGRELSDTKVIACVERAFATLRFTVPEGGIVVVLYPLRFSPDRGDPLPRALPWPARRRQPPSAVVTDRRAEFEVVRSSAESLAEQDADERDWVDRARAKVAQTLRDASAHRQLVRQLLLSGRFPEARQAAERFVAEFPVSLAALEAAADAKRAVLDDAGAAASLAAAVELEPLAVDRQRRAALAYVAAGDERRACAHFRAAAALAPSDLALQFEAFRCRAALGAGRLALLAELEAIVAPSAELEELRRALTEQRALPTLRPAAVVGFSARVECSSAPDDCPTPLLITEDGEVIANAVSGMRGTSVHTAAPEGRMRLYLLGGTLQGASVVLHLGETYERRAASEFAPARRIELQFPN